MGCLSSKDADAAVNKQPQPVPPAPAAPAEQVSQATAAPIPRAKPVITEADRAKHKLKNQRDALERALRRSEDVMVHDFNMARELHAQGKRESALVLLRRRALVQQRVKVTSAQMGKIEDALGTLEGTEATAAVLDAVAAGTKAVEKLNALVSVKRAEQVMRESEDADAYAREVGQVLTGAEEMVDEDEVLAEIAQFEAQETSPIDSAPAVPDVKPGPVTMAPAEAEVETQAIEGRTAAALA